MTFKTKEELEQENELWAVKYENLLKENKRLKEEISIIVDQLYLVSSRSIELTQFVIDIADVIDGKEKYVMKHERKK